MENASNWLQFVTDIKYCGMTEIEAYRDAFQDNKTSSQAIYNRISKFRSSKSHQAICDAADAGFSNAMTSKAAKALSRTVEAYTQLLDHGDKAISEAGNMQDKLSAMHAQRENLSMGSETFNVIEAVSNPRRNAELPDGNKTAAVFLD